MRLHLMDFIQAFWWRRLVVQLKLIFLFALSHVQHVTAVVFHYRWHVTPPLHFPCSCTFPDKIHPKKKLVINRTRCWFFLCLFSRSPRAHRLRWRPHPGVVAAALAAPPPQTARVVTVPGRRQWPRKWRQKLRRQRRRTTRWEREMQQKKDCPHIACIKWNHNSGGQVEKFEENLDRIFNFVIFNQTPILTILTSNSSTVHRPQELYVIK